MRYRISIIALVLVVAAMLVGCPSEVLMGSSDSGSAHPRLSGYKLAWADEFEGSALDTSVWRYDTDANGNRQGWGNNEEQWYTDGDNVSVADGILTIEARNEQEGGKSYTSARLHTHGGRSFQYGVIEARIRMPAGSNGKPDAGIFPAFWLLGNNFDGWGHGDAHDGDTAWPQCGEIDVVEVLGKFDLEGVSGTAHWHAPSGGCQYDTTQTSGHCYGPRQNKMSSISLYDEYHVYSVEWTARSITWYFDYQEYVTLDIRDSQFDEFRQPFFLLLNLAIGGNLGGAPNSANYPQRMLVDWIRHYSL